ncbi:hypothetical protein FJTKL_14635 [Diaporthe vaccinii]|uniref:Uncharacterized protein n=1 Tax=Diaporthe vaccinii TaxID=105482 RepID=A0ABR4E741_9PEZI
MGQGHALTFSLPDCCRSRVGSRNLGMIMVAVPRLSSMFPVSVTSSRTIRSMNAIRQSRQFHLLHRRLVDRFPVQRLPDFSPQRLHQVPVHRQVKDHLRQQIGRGVDRREGEHQLRQCWVILASQPPVLALEPVQRVAGLGLAAETHAGFLLSECLTSRELLVDDLPRPTLLGPQEPALRYNVVCQGPQPARIGLERHVCQHNCHGKPDDNVDPLAVVARFGPHEDQGAQACDKRQAYTTPDHDVVPFFPVADGILHRLRALGRQRRSQAWQRACQVLLCHHLDDPVVLAQHPDGLEAREGAVHALDLEQREVETLVALDLLRILWRQDHNLGPLELRRQQAEGPAVVLLHPLERHVPAVCVIFAAGTKCGQLEPALGVEEGDWLSICLGCLGICRDDGGEQHENESGGEGGNRTVQEYRKNGRVGGRSQVGTVPRSIETRCQRHHVESVSRKCQCFKYKMLSLQQGGKVTMDIRTVLDILRLSRDLV